MGIIHAGKRQETWTHRRRFAAIAHEVRARSTMDMCVIPLMANLFASTKSLPKERWGDHCHRECKFTMLTKTNRTTHRIIW